MFIRPVALFFLLNLSFFSTHFLISAPLIEHSELESYLLPNRHELNRKIRRLFTDPHLFNHPKMLNKKGFKVLKRVHRGLMVISHPEMKNYLIKKFKNEIPQADQLGNYVRRIKGARKLEQFIKENRLRHIQVPKKWLYELPKIFSDTETGASSYLLIVEKIELCTGGEDLEGEIAKKYYQIDRKILRELVHVLYYFRGLDSVLSNVPFTRTNKIAFIDTERWERNREGFLLNILPYLSEDRKKLVQEILKSY